MSPPLQVPSLPAHAGAAAVRALQEGASQRSMRQVHRRAAAAALAALLQEAHAAAAGAGRAAAAAAAGAAARERRRQVMRRPISITWLCFFFFGTFWMRISNCGC